MWYNKNNIDTYGSLFDNNIMQLYSTIPKISFKK